MSFVDAAERYELGERIATGGMGEVWRATDTVLDREVAVKVLKAEYADDPTFRARFQDEARNAAALQHPNVATVYDFGEAMAEEGGDPRPFLVMELVEGRPLSTLIQPDVPLDPLVAADLLAQTAEGVAVAHAAGIVHRDLKPANLLVTPEGQVKITDFGIARAAEAVPLTHTGQIIGTPHYLSPEQADGRQATVASDVYSLGVVLYECLTGQKPFVGDGPIGTALAHLRQPVPDLPASVPPALRAVVRTALAKNPAERFPDAAALAVALREACTSPAIEDTATLTAAAFAPALTGAEPTTPEPTVAVADLAPTQLLAPPSRRPIVWWLIAVAAVVLLALLVWSLADDDGTPSAPSDGPSTAASSTPPATPATLTLDESDYVGKRLLAVTAALRDLELDVTTERVTNPGDETARTVSDVSPLTGLHPGDSVVVSYWGPQPTPGGKPDKHPGKGKGHKG